MLGHLKILSFAIFLLSGSWLIFYLAQVYRSYPYDFIKGIIRYNVVIILMSGLRILSLYIHKNLNQEEIGLPLSSYADFLDLVVAVGMFFLTYFMLYILLSFRDRSFSKTQNLLMFAAGGLLIAGYGVTKFIPETNASFEWIDYLRVRYSFVNLILNNLELVILIAFYFFWGDHSLKTDRIRISKSFTLIFIICNTLAIMVPLTIEYFGIREVAQWILTSMVTMLFLLAPFLWTKFVFVRYARSALNLVNTDDQFESIYLKYQISRRESEIIELLFQGKTTNEIKNLLFLSYHTVKNHISHIYEKLDVKSRPELIHFLIRNSRK